MGGLQLDEELPAGGVGDDCRPPRDVRSRAADGGGQLLGGLVADDLGAGQGEEGFGLVALGAAGVADVEGVAQVVQDEDVGQAPGAGEAELLLQPVDGAVRVREDPPRLVVDGEPLPVARGREGGFHPGGGAGERDRQVRVVVVEVGQVDGDDRGGGVEPGRRRPVEQVLRDGGQQPVERPPGGVPGSQDLVDGAGDPGGEVRVRVRAGRRRRRTGSAPRRRRASACSRARATAVRSSTVQGPFEADLDQALQQAQLGGLRQRRRGRCGCPPRRRGRPAARRRRRGG